MNSWDGAITGGGLTLAAKIIYDWLAGRWRNGHDSAARELRLRKIMHEIADERHPLMIAQVENLERKVQENNGLLQKIWDRMNSRNR